MKEELKDYIQELHKKYGDIEVRCEGTQHLPVDTIMDFQGDLKKLSEKNLKRLAKSIFVHGFISPFFIFDNGGDNSLLDGHGRLKTVNAIREAGIPIPGQFPVVEIKATSEKQAREYLLAITSQFGEFQKSVLDDWVADLDTEIAESLRIVDTELELAIASLNDSLETQGDDEVPENVEPITKLGDLWELGEHRLLCGDSTKVEDVERLMDGQKADMVFTDPPYGKEESGKRGNRDGNTSLSPHIDYEDFQDDTIDYAVKAFNICDDLKIPRQVWWGANYYSHHIPQSNNWFVWDKRVEDKQKDTQSDCELAWVKSKWSSIRIFRHLWKGMIKDSEHGEHRVHPTQKPVALAIWAFDYFKSVNTVLDLFGGSGSSLIACEQTGRKSFMMEFSPNYVSVIIIRWIKWMIKNNKEDKILIKKNSEIINHNDILKLIDAH
jgi:DNA modification methylase